MSNIYGSLLFFFFFSNLPMYEVENKMFPIENYKTSYEIRKSILDRLNIS